MTRAAPPPAAATALRICSWNINDLGKRLALLLAWLDVARPDIVALQETRLIDARFPHAELERAGYGTAAVGQQTWNGVALLARGADPVVIRRRLPGDVADTQARYLEAAIAGIVVASIYLPNGNPFPGPKFDYKLAWFDRLLDHAAELQAGGHPVVLAGDYNVVPTDADIHSARSQAANALLQPQARAAYARLLAQGWTDAIAKGHPGRRPWTFWDYRHRRWERDAGMRIDHLLLSRALGERLLDSGVDRELRGIEGASDHAPVWLRLAESSSPERHRARG